MPRVPWEMVACIAALMLLGLSGIARGDELAHAGEFFSRQIVWIVLALAAMIVAMLFPYRVYRYYSYAALAASILLLLAVYFFPEKWGSRRWIPLGLMNLQPSELAKLTFILALARYLMYRDNVRRLKGLAIPFAIALVPLGLILKEPDLGTALLFLPVLAAMLLAAGARLRHLVCIGCLGAAVSPVFWLAISTEQKSRITALFLQRDGGQAPTGDGYHLHQSKQVLALGGIAGSQFSGMTVDDPLAYHLPACRTDFVICMVGERWGLIGTLGVLGLYLLLFARGLLAAARTREPFGRLLAVGVMTLLATQTIINLGMTVGLAPVTGITLPLLSYGGSSLLFTSLALGLVMNVAMRPGYEFGREPYRSGT
jgi:cell division protein FtsW (lipid II flippase)